MGAQRRTQRSRKRPAAARPPGRPAARTRERPGNPADDTGFTGPLAKALRWHAGQLARQMPEEAAVAWVYLTVLVAWAEDHGLISPWLRAAAAARREQWLALDGMTVQGWQARAMAALCSHPATWCLLDPKWIPLGRAYPHGRLPRPGRLVGSTRPRRWPSRRTRARPRSPGGFPATCCSISATAAGPAMRWCRPRGGFATSSSTRRCCPRPPNSAASCFGQPIRAAAPVTSWSG